MHDLSLRTLACVAAAGIAVALAAQGCANAELDVGAPTPSDGGPGFATQPPQEAGASPVAARCVDTACKPGFATCPNADGLGSTHTCTVDLATDNANCGQCGNACADGDPSYPLFASATCVDGVCSLVCAVGFGDCNGIPEDGCETIFGTNADCGGCGMKCAAGVAGIQGKCGCDPGLTACPTADGGQKCYDLAIDDAHCGTCDTSCDEDTVVNGALVGPNGKKLPPNSHTGCGAGMCKSVKCDAGSFFKFADCDMSLPADLARPDPSTGNGCELDLGPASIPNNNNCAACGTVCAAGTVCADDVGLGRICACKPGQTQCGTAPFGSLCASLADDKLNCGFCNNLCPDAGPHASAGCDRGACTITCDPGWADCNGVAFDGCEAFLPTDPTNCGACGNACELVLGQPCSNGVCSTRDCPPGETK